MKLLLVFSGLLAGIQAYSSVYKVQKLEQLPTGSVINLDSASYRLYTESPRNYSFIAVLTALSPQLGCAACVYVLSLD